MRFFFLIATTFAISPKNLSPKNLQNKPKKSHNFLQKISQKISQIFLNKELHVDKAESDYPHLAEEYWFDPRIHSFGNVGTGGIIHAFIAPLFTYFLDVFAYEGTKVRPTVIDFVANERLKYNLVSVENSVDLGTGTGTTARAIKERFPTARVIGIDTSNVMLKAAQDATYFIDFIQGFESSIEFVEANAERTPLKADSQDLVTLVFVMHEVPSVGRVAILQEAARICKSGGSIAIVDIHQTYSPTHMMQTGEPYLIGYLNSFHDEIGTFKKKFVYTTEHQITKKRLTLWVFHKKKYK